VSKLSHSRSKTQETVHLAFLTSKRLVPAPVGNPVEYKRNVLRPTAQKSWSQKIENLLFFGVTGRGRNVFLSRNSYFNALKGLRTIGRKSPSSTESREERRGKILGKSLKLAWARKGDIRENVEPSRNGGKNSFPRAHEIVYFLREE